MQTSAPATPGPPTPALESYEHRLTVLMFTDLVNSTGIKVQMGDFAYATRVALPHNALFRSLLARFPGGHEMNYAGDGFMACFANVTDAVEMALLFHHALRTHPWGVKGIETRIGIHLGQSIILPDASDTGVTITSHAADICSRLMNLGLGGQTLLTRHAFDDARQYVRAHPPLPEGGPAPDLVWAAHGPYLFKGKDEPLEVFEVGAAGIAPLTPPPDAEKGRRAIRPGEEETLGWRPAQGVEIPGRPDWRLLQRLGEGGFGEVWLAEHGKLKQRHVFKFCFDEERLRSFKRELTFFRLIRDALGERDDIARLYDVKLDAPPFFLESEFAEHGNLVEWCAREGGAEAVPLGRRLEILACVAEAAAAAHSIGILHKDIKPQNILMQAHAGAVDTPQLSDFGIGALADRAALVEHEITAAGFTMDTLAGRTASGSSMTRLYAPPEQLTGKPFTVQGDVFALGVMLYQLAVGDFSRALASGWERDVDDELLREDIAACVDGDPARRLPSAAELATRLRTLEQRRSDATRAREQARLSEELTAAQLRAQAERERLYHTRWIAAVIGVLALVAVAAGISAQKEKVRSQRAETAAENEKREADAQREIAVAARQQAEDGAKAAEAAKQKAVVARKAADELIAYMQYDLHDRLYKIGQLAIMEGVNTRVRKYREDHPTDADDYDAVREKTVALTQNGDLLFARGQVSEALEVFQQTLALRERLVAENPANAKWQRDLWANYLKIGEALRFQGKLDEALKSLRLVVSLTERAVAKDGDNPDFQYDLAMAYVKLGDALRDRRQTDEALTAYRQSLTIRERGVARQPNSMNWQRHLSISQVKLGEVLRDTGQLDEALRYFRDSLANRERLAKKEPGNESLQSELSYSYDRVGDVLYDQSQFDEALVAFRKHLEIRDRLVAQDPENAGWLREVAFSYGKVGNVAVQQQRWADAVEAYRRALESSRPWLARPNAEVLWAGAFSSAAGHLWEVLQAAPAGTVAIDRPAARADLQTAFDALNQQRQAGHLTAPTDENLPWIEKLLREASK